MVPQAILHEVIDRIEEAVGPELREKAPEAQARAPRERREEVFAGEAVTRPQRAHRIEHPLTDHPQRRVGNVLRQLRAHDAVVDGGEVPLHVEAYPPAIRARPGPRPSIRGVCSDALATRARVMDHPPLDARPHGLRDGVVHDAIAKRGHGDHPRLAVVHHHLDDPAGLPAPRQQLVAQREEVGFEVEAVARDDGLQALAARGAVGRAPQRLEGEHRRGRERGQRGRRHGRRSVARSQAPTMRPMPSRRSMAWACCAVEK